MKKPWKVFWIVYMNVVLLLVVFWLFFLFYVRNVLEDYEWSQPQQEVERLIEKLQEGSGSRLFSFRGEVSRFETEEELNQAFMERLKGKELTYRLLREGISPVTQLYGIYADEEKVAEVLLEESNEEPVLVFLTKGYWSLDSVEGFLPRERYQVDVTIPDIYEVSVNGIVLDAGDYASEPKEIRQFQYSKDYVEVPKLVRYLVNGLVGKPKVEVKDIHGNLIDPALYETETEGNFWMDSFVESEMDRELSDMVLSNAKRYANFFTKDLEGARKSVAPIADMFPKDSYYLTLADEYRRHDMWMYSAHETPVFSDETVCNYVEYAEDFFSCEVYFDRQMKLSGSKKIRKDSVRSKFYYAKLDGEWKIVDLETMVDDPTDAAEE